MHVLNYNVSYLIVKTIKVIFFNDTCINKNVDIKLVRMTRFWNNSPELWKSMFTNGILLMVI